MTAVIGIDPGSKGALALLDATGDLLQVIDMPYIDKAVSAPLLADVIRAWIYDTPAVAWVEQSQAMPRQGVTSTFTYGAGYGVILGVLGACAVPTHHVRPAAWKKSLGLTSDKDTSRRRAIELWPAHSDRFVLAKHDGRAEAALIARYGLARLTEQGATS